MSDHDEMKNDVWPSEEKSRMIPTLIQTISIQNEDIKDFLLKYVAENEPEKIFKLCFPLLNTKDILLNAGIEFSEPLQTSQKRNISGRKKKPDRVHRVDDIFDPSISLLRDIANLPIKDYKYIDIGIFGNYNGPSAEDWVKPMKSLMLISPLIEKDLILPGIDDETDDETSTTWTIIDEEISAWSLSDELGRQWKRIWENRSDYNQAFNEFADTDFEDDFENIKALVIMEINENYTKRVKPDICELNTNCWPLVIQKISKHLHKYHDCYKACFKHSKKQYDYAGIRFSKKDPDVLKIDWGYYPIDWDSE